MLKLTLFLLFIPFLAEARVQLAPVKKLDRIAVMKVHEAQIKFLIEWEKKNSKISAPTKEEALLSYLHQVQQFFLADAHAQAGATCLFGGWVSRRNSRGSCEAPWKHMNYASSNRAPAYGPTCGGSNFRCSGLFGGANAPCVPTTSGYTNLTAACSAAMPANFIQSMSDADFRAWKTQYFDPMHEQIANFCLESNEPYNDNTCSTLNTVRTTAVADMARRFGEAVQAGQGQCAVADGDPVASGSSQSRVFFQARGSNGQCAQITRNRLCTNGNFAAWDGDASYTYETCPEAAPAAVTEVRQPPPAEVVAPVQPRAETRAEADPVRLTALQDAVAPVTPQPVTERREGDGIVIAGAAPTPQEEAPPTPPTPPTPQRGRLLASSLIGGAKTDNFFTDGAQSFDQAMSSFGTQPNVFFGGPQREGQCLSTYRENIELNGQTVPFRSLRTNFNPQTCEGLTPLVNSMAGLLDVTEPNCPQGPRNVVTGRPVRGPAGQRGMQVLSEAQSLQRGDTFFLNIADHGSYENGRWSIVLSDGTSVYADELRTRIKAMALRGVNVQLSVDACYSGGFSQEISNLQSELFQISGSKGMVCSTSSQDATLVGYGSDPLLKAGYSEGFFPALQRYGNQLSAAACASGQDMINRPTSSLAEFVRDWNKRRSVRIQAPIEQDCTLEVFEDSLDREFAGLEESMAQLSLRVQRDALLADIKRLWVDPLKACWQENQDEVRFSRQIAQCLAQNKGDVDEYLRTAAGEMMSNVSSSRGDYEDVLQFTKFLSNPNLSQTDLDRFKADFCCLGRNMQTGALPESCQ